MGWIVETLEKALVKTRRKRVSRDLFHKHSGVVQRGLFQGLTIDGMANISEAMLALKIFGLYEHEVVKKIGELGPFTTAAIVGAGDGYYALGLLKAGLAQTSICFESTEAGRDAIARNAQRNGLADRLTILGEADSRIAEQLMRAGFDPAQSLILCDIEGAEFEVFTRETLATLAKANLIIELHDKVHGNDSEKRTAMIANLPAGTRYEIIRSSPPPWSGITDLEALSDNDRALVTSDGRRAIGEWLVVTPKTVSAGTNSK